MNVLALLLVVVAFVATSTAMQVHCLQAICDVSSGGCHSRACQYANGRRGCGYFHISLRYYNDCGSPGDGWIACSRNFDCSSLCLRRYIERYGQSCTGGRTPNCEAITRIHFGGPTGCHSSSTLPEWEEVKRKMWP